MRVSDIKTFWVVGVNTAGRRLLSAAGNASSEQSEGTAPASLSPLCQDAAALGMPGTLRACADACSRSRASLAAIGLLGDVPECTFASFEDLAHALNTQPMLLTAVIAQPTAWPGLLVRSSPLHYFNRAAAAAQRAARVLASLARADELHTVLVFNRTAAGTARIHSTNPRVVPPAAAEALQLALNAAEILLGTASAPNATLRPDGAPVRRLLFAEVAAAVDRALTELDDLRDSYANQVAEVFSYRYADVDTAATRAAWLYDVPPDPVAAVRDSPCQVLTDVLDLFKETFNGVEYALTDRSRQGTPAASLAAAWALVSPPPAPAPTLPARTFSEAVIAGIVAAFRALGVAPGSVYTALRAVVGELRQGLTCDYLAVQTCSKWRIHLMHGVIIVGVWFAAWFVFCGVLNLGFLATITLPAFSIVLMGVCYGYSWTCVPMVPPCLFEDTHALLRTLFPRQMAVPDALLFDSAVCQAQAIAPPPECIRTCADPPLAFASWYSPVAWVAAEAGVDDLSWLSWLPVVDREALEFELRVRAAVLADIDTDLRTANRICALLSSYILVPYALILVLAVLFASALLRSLATLVAAGVHVVGMLFASASTHDTEDE
jgi:hypothetical protein